MMSKPELDESAADGVPSVPITAAFVKAMLRRENQLRWTDEFQRDLALWDGVEKPDPVTKMQEKVGLLATNVVNMNVGVKYGVFVCF
eukprot:m.19082 g.19082  ORF g.19082 m.19082 type:complete len:87 (-) comp7975_c0_seq1:75-335(-)